MDPTSTHPRRRLIGLLLSALTSLALVLGLAPGAAAEEGSGDIDVYVTFEGYNLGQGYYVEPVKLTVPAGRTAAQVTMSVLDGGDHAVSPAPGDPTSGGWYLQGVAGFDTGTANVPAYITSQPGFELTGTNGDGYLGTPDYNGMSGWMYTVDNVAADVGAGAYALADGDVVRWQFTLYGYGCDLGVPSGCWGADPYFTMVDKSDLIRAIVEADPTNATEPELTAARQVAIDPTATQAQVIGAIDALEEPTPVEPWVEVVTTVPGQVLAKLQAALVSDHGQTAGSYDYSVVRKLRVTGPVNSADVTAIRNASYAGTRIRELDLSGAVTSSMFALNGMTALTDVSLPPVASLTVGNLFNGAAALENVTVAAQTTSFGSTTTFTGATSLERITFLGRTAPTTFNAATFIGSNNADQAARVVVAAVPDRTSGGYQLSGFRQYFADVVDIAPNPPAGSEERAGLQATVDEANAITRISGYSDERWATMRDAEAAAQGVLDDADATSGAVADARQTLRTAIDGLLGLSFRVTKGASVGLHQKGTLHFAAFARFDLTKVEELADGAYDVYVPAATLANGTYNVSASINGETDKVVRIFNLNAATASTSYTLDLTPIADREDTPLLIPGFGAGDVRGLYTNLDDTGTVDLEVDETFNLDTIRTVQGQNDQISNYFIEPDYTFEVFGDSISTELIGGEGRRQLAITATEPGVSVIRIGYGPLKYVAANGSVTDFNGIGEQNTGLVVVNVGETDATFSTGITTRNDLDTYYFDRTVGQRDFTFTPAPGTSVRVHDPLNLSSWGSGWRTYQPTQDGAFTVKLRGGRNIIELTNDGVVDYRVVRAKGIDVTIANGTDPGSPFEPGDNAQLTLRGIEGGIEKLAGIYNPAFAAGTKPKLTYSDGTTSVSSNEGGQYTSVTTTYALSYAVGDEDATLDGTLSIGGLGAEWPYHREIPLTGKPANLNAVAIGPYQLGGLPPIYVYDGQVTTRPEGAPVDKTALHAILEEADAYAAGDYTAASWAVLREAVESATAVAADEAATQAEVDESVQGIEDGIAGLAMKGTAPPVPEVPAATTAARQAAAGWLAAQLAANEDVLDRNGSTDWGLTIDAVFALADAKVGGAQIAETADAIYESGEAYAGHPSDVASNWPYVAKTVLALQVAGLDPSTFPAGDGARDLVAELRSTIRPDGSWANATDSFKTSLGILALARTDRGVPAAVVTRFEEKACQDSAHANYGSFGFGAPCTSADVDTTAMAVQALVSAGVNENDQSVANATDWLRQQQDADGGFPSPYGPGNTNSAGLAAEALFAVGDATAATKTAAFIEGLQIGCSTVADEDVTDPEVVTSLTNAKGAIAYNAAAWATGLESGVDAVNLDQWRRATAQAVLGLGAESLGFVSAADAASSAPSPGCPASAPAAPAKPGVTLQGTSITVAWAAPADGGSPITGYTVVLTPAAGTPSTKTVAADATSVVFESLPAGTYTATVTASNAVDHSAASPASESVTVAAEPSPAVTSMTASAGQVVYGRAGRVTVTVTSASGAATPSGTVSTKVGGRTLTAALSGGRATLALPARSLRPGRSALRITYAGVEGRFTATTAAAAIRVLKVTPRVKVNGSKKVKRGRTATYTVTVTAPGVKPTGRVTVKVAGKSRTVRLNARGKAVVKIRIAKRIKPGRKVVAVTYRGDSSVTSARARSQVRVSR